MEGVTDTCFRQVVDKAGRPDLMFTEFTSVEGLWSRGLAYVAGRLKFERYEKPLIAQLWGTTPELFGKTAALINKMGFDGVDINMGCPDRAVVKKGGGAALIENPELAREIIRATLANAGELPVSVKTRIGFKTMVTEPWVSWLLESGIQALIIHGRTAKELSKVPVHWEEIGKAVLLRNQMGSKAIIIGNGDILSRMEAIKKVKQYGVDGVMIGRGVLKNPWVFCKRQATSYKRQEKIRILKYHMKLFEETWEGKRPFVTLRKYFKIYVKGFRGAGALREQLMQARTREEALKVLEINQL
jgi:nifR3 family TIM-barrel protein